MVYHILRVKWLNRLGTPDEFDSLPVKEKFKVILNKPDKCKTNCQVLGKHYGL